MHGETVKIGKCYYCV